MLYRLCVICGLIFLSFPIANGQRVEKVESFEGFMTGIRANAVSGDVHYQRNGGTFALESSMKLEQGDFIRSAAGAYAELLLQPGNYLRVGGETECNLFSDQHDKMRLKLNHGSLIVELLSRETEYYARYLWAEANEPRGAVFQFTLPDAETELTTPSRRT